jgi:predicted membrane protein
MVFAGGELDLSDVETDKRELEMEITAVFGGGKLIVPKNWKINSAGTAIFGGYDIRTDREADGPILNLKGAAIFGGIEVINK